MPATNPIAPEPAREDKLFEAPSLRVRGAESDRVITVTRPLLPSLDDLVPYLADILEAQWVTNNGVYLRRLELEVSRLLETPDLAVVTSATAGLELAVRALVPEGEVITTGFTFPATYHVLFNNPRVRPVFVDIGDDYGLDVDAVEAAITPETRAILAVHTYGYPCDVDRLAELARKHGLVLLYDAAHAFGVSVAGKGIGLYGDLSVFSFHATKGFNTLEGGCITCGEGRGDLLETLRLHRNFGIQNEDEVALFGMNAKMDEVRAAFGLAVIGRVREAISRRRSVVERYLSYFRELQAPEVHVRFDMYARPDLDLNYTYFPILIDPSPSLCRDRVYDEMRAHDIYARKYFYPTVTTSPIYDGLYDPDLLQRTDYASRNVLCLPVHHELTPEDCERVLSVFDSVYRQR